MVSPAAVNIRLAEEAKEGNIEAVRSLLSEQVDVNSAQGDGMTALHWAAYRDDLPLAGLLIEAKANPEAETRVGGVTPLILAARNGSGAMIAALVKAGADPGRAASTGATPLMSAAASGSVDAVKALVDAGADLNAREKTNGQTALMFAAWENRADAIRLLVARGAHPGLTSFVTLLDEPRFDDDGLPIPKRRGEPSLGNSVMGGMTALLFAARDGNLDARPGPRRVRRRRESGERWRRLHRRSTSPLRTATTASGSICSIMAPTRTSRTSTGSRRSTPR